MTSTQPRSRVPAFGLTAGALNSEQARQGSKPLVNGLGSSANTWGSGSIWGNSSAIGSGFKNGLQDRTPAQNDTFAPPMDSDMITGSGSLLPSSESDNVVSRHTPWKSVDESSLALSAAHTARSRASPDRRQKSNHTFAGNGAGDPSFFDIPPAGNSLSAASAQRTFLDPTSRDFVASTMLGPSTTLQSSRQNSGDDAPHNSRKTGYGNTENGINISNRTASSNNISAYNSNVGSRNGSLPPSRGDYDAASRNRGDFQNLQFSRLGTNAMNMTAQRLNAAASAAPLIAQTTSSGARGLEQQSPTQLDHLAGQFDQMHVASQQRRPSYASSQHSPNSAMGQFPTQFAQGSSAAANDGWNQDAWAPESSDYLGLHDQHSAGSSGSAAARQSQSRMTYGGQMSESPVESNARLSHSPFYSNTGTPPMYSQSNTYPRGGHPGTSAAQASALERKLRGLQQQQGYMPHQSSALQFRNQGPFPNYDMNTQNQYRTNPLSSYYPMPPATHILAGHHIPRGPARDHDLAGQMRSPLLEDFRNNSKTNKRYELKDIYEHIVEFSGDQHGSRFIQQKLETANSDEKDQVFRELHPNSRQLMTDVFGNYVIQKFFEHGNQSQKKMLAGQMKNHVLTLSTQMYGCRVVQKALEHILTDQQASLIKELEHDVMRCVRDQNGNHVVQKAIERVPAQHIQFIINAFQGKVGENATHPYGCRVIQRMLEHCEEPTRSAILQELHACAQSLINDQYGNYVTQHVIEHGRPEDRGRIINLIIFNLVAFSKHKFASNVVEKSIEFGCKEEREKIVHILTLENDQGESPIQMLIRDQYGNYVVQKLLTRLQGQEWTNFAEPVKVQVAYLKRQAYGKQIQSVEKLLYSGQSGQMHGFPTSLGPGPPMIDTSVAPTPPLVSGDTQSSQSSSHPSTHANSVDVTTEPSKTTGKPATILSPDAS